MNSNEVREYLLELQELVVNKIGQAEFFVLANHTTR